MKEYIEREAVLRRFIVDSKGNRIREVDIDNWEVTVPIRLVKQIIRETPTADVVERKRGEWVKVGESCGVDLLECPVCHTIHAQDGDAFCRDCGADMRGEQG